MFITFRQFDVFTQSLDGCLWDGEGAGSAGGATPTPSAPAAAPTPAASAPQSATPAAPATSPTSGTPQAPATGAPGDGWVPSYRLREVREAAARELNEKYAAEKAAYEQQIGQIRSQLQALVGVQPPANPEIDAVRHQFAQLFPKLAALEERGEDVLGLLERAGDLESQSTHYWQNYGRQSMDRLFAKAEAAYGAPLTDGAKRALHSAFTGFVSSSPELTARYAQDPTIVDDFFADFTSSFIDPARRVATAGAAARAGSAIPQDTPAGAPPISTGPKPANLDERVAAGWALYNQNKKA